MMNFNTIHQAVRNRFVRLTPGQLVIQTTDRCNATCPQCSMRVTRNFKRHSLDPDLVLKTIDTAPSLGIKAISFTGGEPFLLKQHLYDYIERAGRNRIPFIRTGTNGFFFTNSGKPGFSDRIRQIADRLAATPIRNFWISIDSCDPRIHDQMRGFQNMFDGISKALPIFESVGIYPSVNLGINRNVGAALTQEISRDDYANEPAYEKALCLAYGKAFSKFYKTVIDLGFTIANACYPMSIDTDSCGLDPVYQASASDRIVRFTRTEKKAVFSALKQTIPKFRDKIRIFSPRVALHALIKEYNGESDTSYPCQGGINYFFMDAESGHTFPCGYRGQDDFGRFIDLDKSFQPAGYSCRRCDWECFRDPSELAGPVIDLVTAPHRLLKRMFSDPAHLRLWAADLLYYRACDYFDGRTPPDFKKLAPFKTDSL